MVGLTNNLERLFDLWEASGWIGLKLIIFPYFVIEWSWDRTLKWIISVLIENCVYPFVVWLFVVIESKGDTGKWFDEMELIKVD